MPTPLRMANWFVQAKLHRIAEKAFDCETNQVGIREPMQGMRHLSGRVDDTFGWNRLLRERLAANERDWAMTDPSLKTVVLQLNETDKLGPITIDSANFEIFEDEL